MSRIAQQKTSFHEKNESTNPELSDIDGAGNHILCTPRWQDIYADEGFEAKAVRYTYETNCLIC